MWPNLQFPAGLVTSTKEILNGNLIFCAAVKRNSAFGHFLHSALLFLFKIIFIYIIRQKSGSVYLVFNYNSCPAKSTKS